jgi:hypothetical protein
MDFSEVLSSAEQSSLLSGNYIQKQTQIADTKRRNNLLDSRQTLALLSGMMKVDHAQAFPERISSIIPA